MRWSWRTHRKQQSTFPVVGEGDALQVIGGRGSGNTRVKGDDSVVGDGVEQCCQTDLKGQKMRGQGDIQPRTISDVNLPTKLV